MTDVSVASIDRPGLDSADSFNLLDPYKSLLQRDRQTGENLVAVIKVRNLRAASSALQWLRERERGRARLSEPLVVKWLTQHAEWWSFGDVTGRQTEGHRQGWAGRFLWSNEAGSLVENLYRTAKRENPTWLVTWSYES